MSVVLTAFARSPDRGRGLARDMRVRWALEEVDQPYDVRLVDFDALKSPAHLARNPFGQIPTYEEGELSLFESGAIVLRIAEGRPGLLPDDAEARARAIAWMFAAVSTVDPPIMERSLAALFEREEPWFAARQAKLDARVRARLEALAGRLEGREWLEGDFSAGDLMMVHVLRRLNGSGELERFPDVAAYVARGEARPAFQRAFADQLAVFSAASA